MSHKVFSAQEIQKRAHVRRVVVRVAPSSIIHRAGPGPVLGFLTARFPTPATAAPRPRPPPRRRIRGAVFVTRSPRARPEFPARSDPSRPASSCDTSYPATVSTAIGVSSHSIAGSSGSTPTFRRSSSSCRFLAYVALSTSDNVALISSCNSARLVAASSSRRTEDTSRLCALSDSFSAALFSARFAPPIVSLPNTLESAPDDLAPADLIDAPETVLEGAGRRAVAFAVAFAVAAGLPSPDPPDCPDTPDRPE